MFKRIQAHFVKKKADKMAAHAKNIYVMGHILLIMSNSLKAMKSVSNDQKGELYNLYVKTLYNSMTDEGQIIFNEALKETNEALDKINKGVPSNEVQIKKQLQEIFRSQGK